MLGALDLDHINDGAQERVKELKTSTSLMNTYLEIVFQILISYYVGTVIG